MRESRAGPLVAAAIIMVAAFVIGFFLPKIMEMVSGAGPLGGVAVAAAVMIAFVGVFWLRSRAQKKRSRKPGSGRSA